MSEPGRSKGRRRSRAEVEGLVAEYQSSGMSRSEFCRLRGLSLSTLNRYRQRRQQQDEATAGNRWVAVELPRSNQLSANTAGSGLSVVLSGRRRIEVAHDFDANTLAQLIVALERI